MVAKFSTVFFGLNVGKEFYELSHIAQELKVERRADGSRYR